MARSLCGGSSAGGSYDAVWGHGGTGRRDVSRGFVSGTEGAKGRRRGGPRFGGRCRCRPRKAGKGGDVRTTLRTTDYGLRTHPMIPCNLPKYILCNRCHPRQRHTQASAGREYCDMPPYGRGQGTAQTTSDTACTILAARASLPRLDPETRALWRRVLPEPGNWRM